MNALESTSTRPYLIRALYEWCTDNGFTPYVAVLVDDTVQVPREYVKNGEIVLNISFDATSSLKLGNDFIEFKARFAGTAREIMVPVNRVIAIYAARTARAWPSRCPCPAPATPRPSKPSPLTSVPAAPHEAEGKVVQLVTPDGAPASTPGHRTAEAAQPRRPAPGAQAGQVVSTTSPSDQTASESLRHCWSRCYAD
jgi:stringent starvation protein B